MSDEGRYSFAGLDRVIHERARLGIMTCLITSPEGILFPELKTLCDLTDGNLNRHLKVLVEAQLIQTWKSGAGRKKQTLVRITNLGRVQFQDYLEELEEVVQNAAEAAKSLKPHQPGQLGFSGA